MGRVLGLILAGAWLVLALAPAQAQSEARLTVTGQGSHASVPDMAVISLGVTAQARTAEDALGKASEASGRLLGHVGRTGIDARDVQTIGLSLSPVWSDGTGAARRITGYTASNQIEVKVRGIEELGTVLDGLVEAGANRFNGLQFGLQDPASARDLAREAAVADALHRARILAAAAGVTLGDIVSISEGGAGPMPYMVQETRAAPGVPVAPGEVSFSSSVTVVFSINP